MTIQLGTSIARNDSILFSDLDDELLMMSIDNGEYYSVDSIGAHIWSLLEQPTPVATLCKMLTNEFEVDLATCQEDVLPFLNQMATLDVITVFKEREYDE